MLSAAQYHGAAHHRPQEFQVLLDKARRPIHCGQVRVVFIVRKRLRKVSAQSFPTPRGTIRVSTPEATVVDLVGYAHHVGGLDHVATLLSELVEQIDPKKLGTAVQNAPITWAQRLGYLLTLVNAREQVAPLQAYVKSEARRTVPLFPGTFREKAPRDADWKLFINAVVERWPSGGGRRSTNSTFTLRPAIPKTSIWYKSGTSQLGR